MTEEEIKKLAEEYFETECLHSYADTEEQLKEDVVTALEFGFNKANEWHYPSKGDYPKDEKYVLIYTDLKNTYVTRIPTEKDYFITRRGGFVQMSAVIAWKEIVLPELTKENE